MPIGVRVNLAAGFIRTNLEPTSSPERGIATASVPQRLSQELTSIPCLFHDPLCSKIMGNLAS